MDTITHPSHPSHHTHELPTKPRTLILCFDGTALKFDNDNTNVVKLFDALKRDDPESQLVYYQTGIGTYTPPGFKTDFTRSFARLIDQAFGSYLENHVVGGYRFLMNTYRPGDSICLFGFSRGAYTARALAGMLHKVGLLPAHNEEQIPFAYEMFRDPASQSKREKKLLPQVNKKWGKASTLSEAEAFKQTFSRNVTIDFIGVWDTVSSVGFFPRTLPHTATNPSVKTVRHAISLDEGRINFRVNYWGWTGPHQPRQNDVQEVWFLGEHSDVGGGMEKDWEEHSLSHIPLRWMLRQCLEKTRIIFDKNALIERKILASDGCPINAFHDIDYKVYESDDATSKIHPSFVWNSLWWILEVVPIQRRFQNSMGTWEKPVWRFNFFRGRKIRPEPTTFVHRSVCERMMNSAYTPRAKLPENVQWVD